MKCENARGLSERTGAYASVEYQVNTPSWESNRMQQWAHLIDPDNQGFRA